MSCTNKYSEGDISELMPGTQKSIMLYGCFQMAKQIIAPSIGELKYISQ